jgi:hypothetical protein
MALLMTVGTLSVAEHAVIRHLTAPAQRIPIPQMTRTTEQRYFNQPGAIQGTTHTLHYGLANSVFASEQENGAVHAVTITSLLRIYHTWKAQRAASFIAVFEQKFANSSIGQTC